MTKQVVRLFKKNSAKDLLSMKDYTLTNYSDMNKDSEMEDTLESSMYRDEILDMYGVDISMGSFKVRNKK